MSELELLPWPAVAAILRELGFDEIRCLSLTCTKLYSAVAELTTPEVKVVLPGSLDLPLKKTLLGLKVEIGDLFFRNENHEYAFCIFYQKFLLIFLQQGHSKFHSIFLQFETRKVL